MHTSDIKIIPEIEQNCSLPLNGTASKPGCVGEHRCVVLRQTVSLSADP